PGGGRSLRGYSQFRKELAIRVGEIQMGDVAVVVDLIVHNLSGVGAQVGQRGGIHGLSLGVDDIHLAIVGHSQEGRAYGQHTGAIVSRVRTGSNVAHHGVAIAQASVVALVVQTSERVDPVVATGLNVLLQIVAHVDGGLNAVDHHVVSAVELVRD